MSVLKNNGINLGNGDPSGIANGDLKRVGADLFLRSSGAWVAVGGSGGGTFAHGTVNIAANWTIATGLSGTAYWWAARQQLAWAQAGTGMTSTGTSADYVQSMDWMAAAI